MNSTRKLQHIYENLAVSCNLPCLCSLLSDPRFVSVSRFKNSAWAKCPSPRLPRDAPRTAGTNQRERSHRGRQGVMTSGQNLYPSQDAAEFPRSVWASHRGSVSRFFAKDGVLESGLSLANGRHSATTQGSPMVARKRDNKVHNA